MALPLLPLGPAPHAVDSYHVSLSRLCCCSFCCYGNTLDILYISCPSALAALCGHRSLPPSLLQDPVVQKCHLREALLHCPPFAVTFCPFSWQAEVSICRSIRAARHLT